MRTLWTQEQGAAIITVMLIMLVLLIITPVLFFTTSSEARLSANHADMKQAHYLARSGAEAASDYIIRNFEPEGEEDLGEVLENAPQPEIDLENGSLKEIDYVVGERIITITCAAEFNDLQDTAKLQIINPRSILDYAIFNMSEEEPLSLGRILVDAIIGSNHEVEWSDSRDGPDEYDEYAGITEDDIPIIDLSDFPDGDGIPRPLPPGNPPVVDEENYYEALEDDVRFEVDGDLHIRTAGLNIGGNTVIEAGGDGVLHLLVENEFNMSGNPEILAKEDARIIIYFLEDEDVHIDVAEHQGGPVLDAFVYGPYTDFHWSGAGNQTITGGIICDNFHVDGGSNTAEVIHDPDLLAQGAFENIEEILEQANTFQRHLWLK